MRAFRWMAVVAVTVAVIGIAAVANADNRNGGSGSVACNDGTITYGPTVLWPPNHKLATINISYADTDNDGDSTKIVVGMISDNQMPNGEELQGSGNPHLVDWTGTGNTGTGSDPGTPAATTAQVRAERSGTDPNGRTYTIQVTCTDSGGTGIGETTGEMQTVNLTVFVPHDQGH